MTMVLGHQGASRAAPGNTLAAFRAAAELGADGVELDVRRTDGGLAVRHDAHLPDGRALLTLEPGELPDDVPSLEEALVACVGLRLVNVEIKNSPMDDDYDAGFGVAERVAEVLLARPPAERTRVVVSCFDRPTVDRFRQLAPEIATAWLTIGFATVEHDLAGLAEVGHRAVHPLHQAVDEEVVRRAHDAGLMVNAWTCDDPDRIRRLADIGTDGIITNVPDVALRALGRSA